MADIKLNSSFDLDLSTGDIQFITGVQEAAQRVTIKLRSEKGSWEIVPTWGMPYLTQVLGQKDPDLDTIQQLLIRAIETEPGITKVTSISLRLSDGTLFVEDLSILVDGDFVDFASFAIVELA